MWSLLFACAFANPASLECGNDQTTRLKIGATVMGGPGEKNPPVLRALSRSADSRHGMQSSQAQPPMA